MSEEYYREKYLKYKAKYQSLKAQVGGITLKSGIACYFVNQNDGQRVVNLFNMGRALTITELNREFHRKGIRVFEGEKVAELVVDTTLAASEKASLALESAAQKAASVASQVGTKIGETASKVGTKIGETASSVASQVGTKISSGLTSAKQGFGSSLQRFGQRIAGQNGGADFQLDKPFDRASDVQNIKNIAASLGLNVNYMIVIKVNRFSKNELISSKNI